jgi:hypothetical protein
VEAKASDSPVCLGIAPLRAREHNVEHKEGEKYSEHTDKLQHRSGSHTAILFLFCRLDKSGKHNADAKEVADVGEMHVEIPTDHTEVIKDSKTCDSSDKSEGAVNCVINKLCGSVFYHNTSPFILRY